MTDGPGALAPAAIGRRWWIVLTATGLMFCVPYLVPAKAPPVPSFHAEALAAVLGLLALCLAWFSRRGEALPLPLTLIAPMGVASLLLVQLLTGFLAAREPALLGLLYLLWCAGMIVLGATLRRAFGLNGAVAALAAFMAAGGVLSALAGLAQLLDVSYRFAGLVPGAESVWGNLAQRNHFADHLALALASVIALWSLGRLSLPLTAIAGVLIAWMLPMSASRSVWLYAGAFLALALLWHWRARSPESRRLLWASGVALAVMLAAEWAWSAVDLAAVKQETSAERLREAGAGGERWHLWVLAWRMFAEAPWSGVGYGQYAWNYFLFNALDPRPLEGYAHHAHNLALHLGAEFGVGGMLALTLGGAAILVALMALPRTAAGWWLCALCAVLGIHAMLEYPLWYTYFLGVAAVLVGLCGGRAIEFRPTRLMGAAVVVALAMSWFALATLYRDYVYLENFLALGQRQVEMSRAVDGQALQRLLGIRRTSLLASYVELGLARAIRIDPGQLDAKVRVNGHAMRLYPVDDVVFRHAMLLALQGHHGLAARQWERARLSYPSFEPMALSVLRQRADEAGGGLRPLLEHVEALNRR